MPRKPSGRRPGRPAHPEILTPAEQRVLEHVREGLPNAEIGVRLGISPDAVKYHVSNMLGKLQLTNRQELAAWKPGREPVFGRRWAGVPLALKWFAGIAAVGTAAVAGIAIFAAVPKDNPQVTAGPLPAGIVSVATDGTPGNANSGVSSLSTDGRFVAFESKATNLVPGDTNGQQDIFLHDRREGTTVRVSVGAAGAEADGQSSMPAISGNGRFVAFVSSATNLTSNGSLSDDEIIAAIAPDRVAALDRLPAALRPAQTALLRSNIYVRDLEKGTTELVSIAMDGRAGNLPSGTPSISDDGRYVAFDSGATNLVPNDTNGNAPGLVSDLAFAALAPEDVFVRDRQSSKTTRVSVVTGGAQAEGSSAFANISGDGRFVAFVSDAGNLVPERTGAKHLHLHDTVKNTTIVVPVADPALFGQALGIGRSALSADGRWLFVAVLGLQQSSSTVPGSAASNLSGYLFNSQTGSLEVIAHIGGDGPNQAYLSMSADGRLATMMTQTKLPPSPQIVLTTLPSGNVRYVTTAVAVDSGSAAYFPALSGDGGSISFTALVGGQAQVIAQAP
jgi:DNA-binding CsgD family transcriptional regulator/Tol biopolymer transport system component